MADEPSTADEASAEKAYAAAAEAVSAKPETPAEAPPVGEVAFPPKAKRTPKTKAPAPAVAAAPAATKEPAPKKAPKPRRKAAAKPAALKSTTVSRKAAPKAVAKPKVLAAKPKKAVAKKASKPVAKPVAVAKPKPIKKPAGTIKPTVVAMAVLNQLKDKTMDTAEITSKIKTAVSEVQEKAKEALDKGAAAFSEYNDFSKGNLEAVVESGKILASGMQSLGTTMVSDGKAAFETLSSEVKELTKVKSPTDFLKLQTEFMRKNFDTAVAYTSKNSEAMLKIASDAAAPISGRFSLALDKIKKAA